MWPLIIMGAQMGLQMYGQQQANRQQAEAEARNAEYYKKQAQFAEQSTQREMRLQERQQARLRGEQIVGFTEGNVDVGSGTALDFLVEQESYSIQERAAIRSEGDMRVELALLRGESAQTTSNTLNSSQYNNTQAAGTILSGASNVMSYGASSGKSSGKVAKPKK